MRFVRPMLAVLAAALLLAPAAARAGEPTGRLLVILDAPQSKLAARTTAALLARADLGRDGAQAPQIGLVSVRPVAGLALGF